MNKSNLELFKQAISEAVSNQFDKMADKCTEKTTCSKGHQLAMRTIVYGKADPQHNWSPKMKRIIAILVAAALLLVGCGIIFRNEIREIFEETFVKVTYSDTREETRIETIEDVYELGYLPEGYTISSEVIRPLCVRYELTNANGDQIWFEQSILNGTNFIIDIEDGGYTQINDIQYYEVYYRYTNNNHLYIWNDSKYAMKMKSNIKLSSAEIVLIINDLVIK